MKQRITLKNIAKELGVSISTVSKALKDNHEISKEVRERIKAYANFQNYRPNKLALKLRSQKTLILGVIVPKIVHYFFSDVLRGIENYANEKGYNVMVCLSNDSFEKEVLSIETLLEGSVDGIIISVTQDTYEKGNYDHIKKLIDEKFPIVLFDNIIEDIQCDMVSINDEGGAFNATEYLIKTGCKRIALLTMPEYVKIGSLRTKGYVKALNKHNIEMNDDLIIEFDDDKNIHKPLESLFNDKDKYPDAILAVNGEIFASTAMQIAINKGLKIPQDVSVITFTDGLISKYSSPPLTALVQHSFEMGKQAVELLINRIENENSDYQFESKVISTNLKIRSSTKSLKEF